MQRIHTEDQGTEAMIQAKGKTGPRVTPQDIAANIAREFYFSAGDGVYGSEALQHGQGFTNEQTLNHLTFCVLVLQNGFTVTGESACASPENFDAEIGKKVARENAVQKIRPLMGYALKQELHRRAVFDASPKVGSQVETKTYADGTSATGTAPLPDVSPNGAPSLPPHQQRVVIEKDELDQKLASLRTFLESDRFSQVAPEEQKRMADQAKFMQQYSDVLWLRIDNFPKGGA